MKKIALLTCVAAALAWLRWRPFRVEIEGGSMEPELLDGDWALAIVRGRTPRPGDIVVAEHPDRPGFEIVKRAVRAEAGGWWLEGDAAGASTDSRSFGPVPGAAIRGRVVAVYAPSPRIL